jgi:ferrous iron transport protein B
MCSRGWAYVVKAGTVILLCNTLVQLMQSFDWSFRLVEEGMADSSILASVAKPFAVLLVPLGFGVWQMAAAAITGFIAKENVVGTLAVCYGVTNFIDTDELALMGGAGEVAAIFALTRAAALACLMFNLFTPPCFAALGAMNAEMNDRKWFWGGIALQLSVGYTLAFVVYQAGTLLTTGTVGAGFVPGLAAVAAIVGVIIALVRRADRRFAAKTAQRAMVIGGGSIYKQMLPYCDTAYITKVHVTPGSDTYFPNLDEHPQWELSEVLQSGEEDGIAYEMCIYTKKGTA